MMLCVNWTFLNQTELSEDEKVFYEQIYEWNWKPINTTKGNNIPDGGYKTTFEQRTPSCDTIYRNCMVGGDRILCDDLFVKELSPVGACCRLILSKLNTDRPSKSVTFEPISYPIRSYIVGDLGLYPPRNRQPTFTFTIPIQVHLDMKMTQSTASLRLLTRRQRGCIFSDEEETLDCCILRCQKRKILGICGCLPWFLASSEEPECSIQQYSCLIQHADRLQHPK
ncbi:uncharacterized protein LOC107267130 isoform X3 [Cephus cinctus]|nr:uncharacterized protein LOC107267130 isoform X3 [Cephus cinctus]